MIVLGKHHRNVMKAKRILLIAPPITRPPDMLADKVRIPIVAPLGLAYIAAVLEQQGYEVKIVDCIAEGQLQGIPYGNYGEWRYGLNDERIVKVIEDFNPELIGVSCLFSNQAYDAHNICRIAKMINLGIITVMGGAHPTALPEETLKDRNIDYIVIGEGEITLPWLLKLIERGHNYQAGVQWGIVDNLDSLPFPACHLLNMPKYLYSESPHSGLKRTPMATIITSRGCPGNCEFCAIRCLWGDAYRVRSPENVLMEIQHLVDKYHIKELHFEDDNLTANKNRAMAIFQGIIDRKLDLTLNSPSGLAVFALDEELLDKMKEAGYYSISLAVESAVPEVLKLMRKQVDLVKAKRLSRYARSLGMKTKVFFILGYPGETKETMKCTVDFAGNLGADWCLFFPATNLPGTDMDKRVRENGWLVDPNMDYRYYFYKPNIRTPEFDPDFVIRLREEANRQINFENNINMREGNYERAAEDFGEVVRLYPHLDYAKEALKEAKHELS